VARKPEFPISDCLYLKWAFICDDWPSTSVKVNSQSGDSRRS
jgi:hypothetical protein